MRRSLSVSLALSLACSAFALDIVNLTSDAYSKGTTYYEYGYGTLDTTRGNVENLFQTTGPTGDRYMSLQNTAVPNYISFHFKDAYEPDRQIVVNKLYLNVSTGLSAPSDRRPKNFELQGANDPNSPFVAGADTDGTLRASSEGWTTIRAWTNTVWQATSFAGKNVLAYEDSFDNTASYRYYRLLVTETGSGQTAWLQFSRLQLHGYAADDDPAGMAVSVAATESAADVALSCTRFSSCDPSVGASAIYLDYSTTDTFAAGSYTRIVVAQSASGTNWSDTVHLSPLFPGTTYYGRFIIENAAGGSGEVHFPFATQKAWYVSGTGDDASGDGSTNAPFRTITRALYDITNQLVAVMRPAIYLDEGVYSASNGEQFPVELPAGTSIRGWSAAGEAIGREDRIIDGEDEIGRGIFVLSALERDCSLSDLYIRNARRAVPLYIDSSDCIVSNCLFTQTEEVASQSGYCGGITANGLSRVTVDDCAFIGMTNRSHAVQVTGESTVAGAEDDRLMTIRRCLFADNRLSAVVVGGVYNTYQVSLAVCDSVFRGNVLTTPTALNGLRTSGACIGVCGHRVDMNWYGSLSVDRCQFLGNTANMVIGAQFLTQPDGYVDGDFRVSNSLFADNVPYSTSASGALYGTVHSYRATALLHNCTFLRNFGSLARNAHAYACNCIFADETLPLVPGNSYGFAFADAAIVSNCDLGTEAAISGMANILPGAPIFVNADGPSSLPGFDARLKAYSPGIDAGHASGAIGATDLAGNPRIADNTLLGEARPDLGAYESLYNAEIVPTFRMPSYGLVACPRGEARSIAVALVPSASVALPLTATLAGPADWGLPASIVFDSDSATFQFTPPANAGLGEAEISISAPGVVGATLDVNVVDEHIAFAGDRLLVLRSANGAFTRPFSMATDGIVASTSIPLAILSVDGPSTVAWDADEGRSIAQGEAQSEASVVVTPVKGATTVTFQAGADFVESGAETFTLDIVVDPDFFAIDPLLGSDTTGIGTPERPFLSMTAATGYAAAGDTLLLAAGAYTPATESYPLDAAGLAIVGATGNPEDVVLTGTNGVANLFQRSGSYATPLVGGATLAGTTGAIASLMDASIAFSNCVFRQTLANTAEPAVGYLYRASRLEMANCVVSNFNRFSAISFDTTDADVGMASRSRDRWFEATRCLFENARCERAFVASCRPNGTPNDVRLSECTFRNLRMYTNNAGLIPGSGSNVYYAGLFHVPTGLAQGGEKSCWFKADRCVFEGCKGCTLVSTSHANAPEFTNCLFADMTNSVSILWGNLMANSGTVRNCTFIRTSGGFAGGPGAAGNALSTAVENTICDNGELKSASGGSVLLRYSLLHDTVYGPYAFVTNIVDEETGEYTVSTNLYFGNGVLAGDPLFRNGGVDSGDPDFDATLRSASPAMDAGSNAYVSGELDLAGNARIYHGTVDMGCYERQSLDTGLIFLLR